MHNTEDLLNMIATEAIEGSDTQCNDYGHSSDGIGDESADRPLYDLGDGPNLRGKNRNGEKETKSLPMIDIGLIMVNGQLRWSK